MSKKKSVIHHKIHLMKRLNLVLGTVFFIGVLLGMIIMSLYSTSTTDGHSHQSSDHSHMERFDASEYVNKPDVNIQVTKDLKSGWNVRIQTNNFEFAPQSASQAHVDGQGHAHIYVNGEKINRVYGEWYHIADLHEGDIVRVTLNTNDHKDYVVNGEVVESIYIIE